MIDQEETKQLLKTMKAKHHNGGDWSVGIPDFCEECTRPQDDVSTPWPCDVIQVIHAWEWQGASR